MLDVLAAYRAERFKRRAGVPRWDSKLRENWRDKNMKVEVQGKNLVITIPLTEPTPSASGKTLVVASTHGNKEFSDAKVNGKPVTIGLNAYIKP